MVKITFLIGNGFDLQAGLSTSYEDFLQHYIEKESKTEAVHSFKKELRRDLETWSDFELAMGNYTKAFSEKNLRQFVDIMDDVRQNLMEYLQQEEGTACYDGREQEIAGEMRRMLEQIAVGPGTYSWSRPSIPQRVQCHFISFNYTRVFDRCLAIARTEMEKYEKNKAVFVLGDTVHIHGTIEGHSLLGVNDESQIANRRAAFDEWFQCRFIKPLSNESLRGSDDRRAMQWIQESDMICIFGMSMGKTDSFWWKLICCWLKECRSRHLAIFKGSGKDRTREHNEFIAQAQKVKNQFFEASSLDAEEVSGLSAQIYAAPASGLFELRLKN